MAPNEPIPCGGNGDDFDDGLSNAYFPDGMWYTQTANVDGSGSVTVFADGESSEYTTYVAGRPNPHDSDTCQNCIAIAQEQERIRAQRDAEPYEHLFDHVGLASQESEGDDMESDLPPIFPEHDESKVLPCNGIQDIIFTGKVCCFFFHTGVVGMDTDVWWGFGRRTSVMGKPGTTSIIMDEFDDGTGLSASCACL